MAKPDIRGDFVLSWDEYSGKSFDQALPSIYDKAKGAANRYSAWYWSSIATKRRTSLGVRGLTFVLLIAGTLCPLLSGLSDTPDNKLLVTQLGVGALALAGLLQIADRVFGWSSGWIRYITTATAMESVIRAFELEWARYILARSGKLDSSDVKPLFDLAAELQKSLAKHQDEETESWKTEFNSGASLLGEMIKSQRESGDKAAEAAAAAQAASKALKEAAEIARHPGAVRVSLVHKGAPQPITISFDGVDEIFNGTSWVKEKVDPGIYKITITTKDTPPIVMANVVTVKAAEVALVDFALG